MFPFYNLIAMLHNRFLSRMIEVLPKVLEDLFPYINKSIRVFDHYTRNLLNISLYLPSLRMGIFELVISNMLKLDVSA